MRPAPLDFEPWAPAPALRTVAGGPATGSGDIALLGLDDRTQPAVTPPEDLCGSLFDQVAAGSVPVAFFTDQYCPNCRSMAETLSAAPGITVTRHELPILGPNSVLAARAIVAAGLQGKEEAFHLRLRRAAFAPNEAYLREVAGGMGLDPDRLAADMNGVVVEAALERDLRLASALGLGVVPATVIGQTVVIGDIGASRLERIIEAEALSAPFCPPGT